MELQNIRVDRAFILFARCSIRYEGRASSTCVSGDYAIMRKGDGTFLVHGGAKFNPLNYQGPGAILKREQNTLISTRKKEILTVIIDKIHQYEELENWSYNKIDIFKTESDLVRSISNNITQILDVARLDELHTEFPTPNGPIDLIGVEGNLYHVIEVKRGKASLQACAQLERYLKYFQEIKQPARGYIMSPEISKGAAAYCAKNGLTWMKVTHDPSPLQTPHPSLQSSVASAHG